MKKALALGLALIMCLSLVSFAAAEGYSGDIRLWVTEAAVEFTKEQVEAFKKLHEEYAGMNVIIESVGENTAATEMIKDVERGADLFVFAQDQLARLVAAGALIDVAPENAEIIRAENDAGAVAAVTLGDTMYAYPMTSDNGYFLYYDKSVVTDPSNLEQILADCEAAGKNFYFHINNGWYQYAFFKGAGCEMTFDCNDEGDLIAMHSTYATENGVKALRAMIKMAQSPAFKSGSSVNDATNLGAIVDGTWDSSAARKAFGDNFGVIKLPTVDGFQLGGFGGFKMLGVKNQTEEDRLIACDALAAYLSSGEVQLARYNAVGWGPSNLEAQQSEDVQADEVLAALAAQLAFTAPQGQYPTGFWQASEALGNDIIADKLDDLDDDALMQKLVQFEQICKDTLDQ